jgi:peptide/nickel transport system substrate-binding protein
MRWRHFISGGGAVLIVVAGCLAGCTTPQVAGGEPGASGGRGAKSPPASSSEVMKRVTLGTTIEQDFRPTARGPASRIQALVNTPLTFLDGRGERHPFLAETVPSLENGLWTLLPDGRMETIWRIRPGALWHDGMPVTTDDLLFSLTLGRDPELSAFSSTAYGSIAEATRVDDATLLVTWKEPYIDADALFDFQPQSVLPWHRLERAYLEDKSGLLDLPYWTHEYVGSGPYRINEWSPGLGVVLEANREYVLGRPKITQIEVRFIPDGNALAANLLAGVVDIASLGSADLGLQLRDQWHEGSITFSPSGSWIAMYPQFVNPQPAVVADVRFRRALISAIDRQEIVDTLIAGLSPVAHSILSPGQPRYEPIEARSWGTRVHPTAPISTRPASRWRSKCARARKTRRQRRAWQSPAIGTALASERPWCGPRRSARATPSIGPHSRRSRFPRHHRIPLGCASSTAR